MAENEESLKSQKAHSFLSRQTQNKSKKFIDSDEYENNYILNRGVLRRRRIYMISALACTDVVKDPKSW